MSQVLQVHQSGEEEHLVEDAMGAKIRDVVGTIIGGKVEDMEHLVQRVVVVTTLSPQMQTLPFHQSWVPGNKTKNLHSSTHIQQHMVLTYLIQKLVHGC